MPLTPADVHNVAFSKPPIGKRGYNEDEVDAFLDLVEQELSRLIEENADLRQRVGELDQELAEAKSGRSAAPQQSLVKAPEPEPIKQAPSAPAPAPVATSNEDSNLQAAKVLGLAQEMADRLTSDAKNESEQLLASARANSERMISDARTRSDAMVSEARQKSESLLADAQTRSETQLRQAKEKADALKGDAERKHTEIMASINQEQASREGQIERLKTFEREYRVRLKSYLESQLQDLEQRAPALPAEKSPVGSGGYANGSPANGSTTTNGSNGAPVGYGQTYGKGNN